MPHYIDKQDSNKIKAFSFVFALVIVFYHANNFIVDSGLFGATSSAWVLKGYELLASIAMAYFFMTTGYLLYHNADKDSWLSKLRRRVKTLVIPFIVWNIIFIPYCVFVNHYRYTGILDLFLKFTFQPFDGPLWYVFAIILMLVFLPLFVRLRDKRKLCITIFSLMTVISVVYFSFTEAYWVSDAYLSGLNTYNEDFLVWTGRFARYLPAYLLGAGVGLLCPDAIRKDRLSHTGFPVLLAVLFAFLYLFTTWVPSAIFMLAIVCLPCLIWCIVPKTLFKGGWVKKYCRNAFFIYAVHFLPNAVLYFILKKLTTVIGSGGVGFIALSLVFGFFAPIFAYLVCLAAEMVLKRFHCQKILELLTGNRS